MRRLVAVLIVAALAVSLAGCGGGGDAAQSSTPPATTPKPAAVPAPAPGAATAQVDRSVNETSVFEAFPTGDAVPAAVAQRIAAKQPTLIYFSGSNQSVSRADRAIIDAVRDENRGLVDLVTYDLGKYVSRSDAGTISIDPKFAGDPAAIEAANLAQVLGVSAVPFVVLTDGQGYIIWKYRGLLSQPFLEREVQRAAK